MENEGKRPPALNLYSEACSIIQELEPIEAGNVILAAISYYENGELPGDLSKTERLAFADTRKGIDYARWTYEERCRKNAENARNRKKHED